MELFLRSRKPATCLTLSISRSADLPSCGLPRPNGSIDGASVNIIQVSTGTYPAPSGLGGGVEDTVHHLSTSLAVLGHKVTVIDIPNPNRQQPIYNVSEVVPWWQPDSSLPFHVLRGLSFQGAVRNELNRLLAQQHYDVVHFHSQIGVAHSLTITKDHGALAIFNTHNAVWCSPQACRSPLLRAKFIFEMQAFRKADLIFADSEYVKQNLISSMGLPAGKVETMPIGLPDHWFTPVPIQACFKEKYAPNRERVVLCMARIAPYKNQLALVRAMALVAKVATDAKLILAGPLTDKRYTSKLRRAINALGLRDRVVLAGPVPFHEHRILYELCDAFVLASVAESQGLSVLEAMAVGRPVVGSAIGPVANLLRDGAGVLVPPTDHNALARAILQLLENPGASRDMAERARQRASAVFRWRHVAQRVEKIYWRSLKPNQTAHS